jgi:mannose-1-phosphate guanylyltransferase
LSLLDTGTFVIANGDTLTDLDLSGLLSAHARSNALVTLALVPNTEPHRYGGVRLDEGGRVAGFVGKGGSDPSFHFIGVQAASAGAFECIADGAPVNSVGGVYDELLRRDSNAIRGFVCDAAFWDVGTPWDYLNTSEAIGRADSGGVVAPDASTIIDPSASVTRSVLWEHVRVGRAATLDECIVTDGVRIPAGASYRRSIIMRTPDADDLMVSPLSPL